MHEGSRHFSSFPFMKEMTCLALLGKAGEARPRNIQWAAFR
jgi:hypothetical protein